MPFQIVRDDIIRMPVDAIVCPTDSRLSGSGGLDASVHIAAGPKMAEECRKLGGCPVGEARIVPGFWLSAKHVIFAVGPKWSGNPDDAGLLYSCVRFALTLAAENALESVAIPLISTGTFGFPKDAAMETERAAITDFLEDPDTPDLTVYLVLYGSESYALGSRFFPRIQAYINDHYSEHRWASKPSFEYFEVSESPSRPEPGSPAAKEDDELFFPQAGSLGPEAAENVKEDLFDSVLGVFQESSAPDGSRDDLDEIFSIFNKRPKPAVPEPKPREEEEKPGFGQAPYPIHEKPSPAPPVSMPRPAVPSPRPAPGEKKQQTPPRLDDRVHQLDESFQQMLLRKIDERGMTDAECYKKANVDRKLFSKIRSDVHYRPSKATAIAFAVALELDLNEAEDLLKKAGFAFSNSNLFDVIVSFFIEIRNYNVFDINDALFAYDQTLLGG